MIAAMFDVLDSKSKDKIARIAVEQNEVLDESRYAEPVLFRFIGTINMEYPNVWASELRRHDT